MEQSLYKHCPANTPILSFAVLTMNPFRTMRAFKYSKILAKQTVPRSILSRSLISSANIVTSDLPDVSIPSGQITSFIAQKTLQYGGTVAMEDGITGETMTFHQLLDRVGENDLKVQGDL